MTRPSRGSWDQPGAVAAPMSDLRPATRSSATDDDAGWLMTSGTTGSGCGAADARRARRPSPCCLSGRRRMATTATTAASRRGMLPARQPGAALLGLHAIAGSIRRSGVGRGANSSASGLGLRAFPGGGRLFRRAHHPCLGFSGGWAYSASGGKLPMSAHAIAQSQAADSVVGLPGQSTLAARQTHRSAGA